MQMQWILSSSIILTFELEQMATLVLQTLTFKELQFFLTKKAMIHQLHQTRNIRRRVGKKKESTGPRMKHRYPAIRGYNTLSQYFEIKINRHAVKGS